MRPANTIPSRNSVTTIRDDGSRRFVHPADVKGPHTLFRKIFGLFLISVYVLLPWIPINGHPAVFLDVERFRFHLFGLTFVAQDLWLGFFLITGVGFGLFYITALIGRVWCGLACPQTVFLDQVYRRVERWIEGDAVARRRLEARKWDADKIIRRASKYFIFAIISVAIAHVFISYFISIPSLYVMMHRSPLANASIFGVVAFLSGALFFNFTWFREQFCIIMCPYGRLQGALVDDHTVVIGYDVNRGEPRGKIRADTDEELGDCIDCLRCVQVCPTGIDIRQGLQMECVSCSACIDACDDVMTKVERPKGLIRYASNASLSGGKTQWIRGRTMLYTGLLLLGTTFMLLSLSTLRTVQMSALRMPGNPYYLDDGMVRNQYLLRVANKRNQEQNFKVTVEADQPAIVWSGPDRGVRLGPISEQNTPLIVQIPRDKFHGPFSVKITVTPEGSSSGITKSVPFLGPDIYP